MAGVVPKGFEIVPDERLPNVPSMAEAPDPLDNIPEGGEAVIGQWPDGTPRVRRRLGKNKEGVDSYIDGGYNPDGSWYAGGVIDGDLNPPEGFEPLSLEEQEALPSPPEGSFYNEYGELVVDSPEVVAEMPPLEDQFPDDPYAGKISGPGSSWAGLKSGALLGFDDEWQAGVGALANKVGTMLGVNESDASLEEIYSELLRQNREYKDSAYNQNALAYGIGYLPGALLTAPIGAGRVPATVGGRVAQASAVGAAHGGISGAGNDEGNILERLDGAGSGAVGGAIGGAIAYPLTNALGTVGQRILERVRRGGADSGLDALAARAAQDGDQMLARAAELEAVGVPPRLVDVVDESGRGVIRTAANKMTPARQDMADAADEVYTEVQDRVAQQARDVISAEGRTGRQVADDVRELRGDNFEAAMDPVRGQPIPITQDLIGILSTREGRAALRGAEGLMTDPAERQAVRRVMDAVRAADQIDPRLPEAAQRQIREQIFQDTGLTVDMADKFARAMRGRATKTPGLERVANDFSRTVRDAARTANPVYDDALNAYSAASRVADAAEGTGDLGGRFLREAPDVYRQQTAGASPVTDNMLPMSERSAMRVRARDEIADAAGEGSAQAMGVARKVARSSSQNQRSQALLGEEGADRLRRGMQGELSRVENTRFIDPRMGSKTASVAEDSAAVDGLNLAETAMQGRFGTVRAVSQWLRGAGIKNVDAERLTRDAISNDPVRVRAAIDHLVERGMARDRAGSLVRTITSSMTGRLSGSAAGTDRPPPGSTRALLRADPIQQ